MRQKSHRFIHDQTFSRESTMPFLAQLLDDVVVQRFEIEHSKTTMGRSPSNVVVIDDAAISSAHAVVSCQPNAYFSDYLEYFIEDLGSTNGTYLNDQPLQGRQRLRNNDIVRLAWNTFKFLDEKEAEMEKTVQILRSSE